MALQVTGLYAGILGLWLLFLSGRVIQSVRVKGGVSVGDGGKEEHTHVVRGQGNFIEYVPMAVLLLGILELQGTSTTWLHALGAALVLFRVMHPFGMSPTNPVNSARFIGTVGTFTVLLASSVLVILHFAGVNLGVS